jgi:putative aldouronate transport system substrate-binding protein
MSMQLFFGSFEKRLLQRDDGTFGIVPPPAGVAAGPWRWMNGPAGRSPMYLRESLVAKVVQDPETNYRDVEVEQDLAPYFYPVDRVYPPVSLTLDESQVVGRHYVTVKGYMDQMLADFIVNGNVDSRWPEYIRTLESMGLRNLESAYDTAYRRFVEN